MITASETVNLIQNSWGNVVEILYWHCRHLKRNLDNNVQESGLWNSKREIHHGVP